VTRKTADALPENVMAIRSNPFRKGIRGFICLD
jgi:hypothetical protein